MDGESKWVLKSQELLRGIKDRKLCRAMIKGLDRERDHSFIRIVFNLN